MVERDERDAGGGPPADVMALAWRTAGELAAAGAAAVVLVGSYARGDAHPESDVDLIAVGRGPAYHLERRGPFLVSISWRPAGRVRRAFRSPPEAGVSVPTWRRAVVLHDPNGVAGALRQEALDWTWDRLGRRCDAWVAQEITGYAEEVHRLVISRERGRTQAAAVLRSVLALRMAPIVAVHRRLLYETESRLWDLVADVMGRRWQRAQAVSLGAGGEAFRETCEAALDLYALTAAEVRGLLDGRQRAVVEHACRLAGRPLPSGPGTPS